MRCDRWRDSCPDIPDLMSRLSRLKILGATLQFESKSGCGGTVGATHVQTFQTLCSDFPDSKFSARLCNLGPNPNGARPLATPFVAPHLLSRLSRFKLSARLFIGYICMDVHMSKGMCVYIYAWCILMNRCR